MDNILRLESVDARNVFLLKQVGEIGRWAYMDHNPGDLFVLSWPKGSRKNPSKPKIGDIIILKQQSRLTHLVIPYSDEIIEKDLPPRWPLGRKVICLMRFDRGSAPLAKDVIPFSTSGGSHGIGYPLESFLNSHPGIISLEGLQQKIWKEFFPDRDSTNILTEGYERDNITEEYPEGKVAFGLHKRRERNPDLIKKAKEMAFKKQGELTCNICKFSFKQRYGDIGDGFIEAHHKIPVSKLEPESKTKIEDIALVCSNCHSMLHHRGGLLSVEQLKLIIDNGA